MKVPMAAYRAITEIPPLIQAAMAGAGRLGFTRSCTVEVGRLLRLLASQVQDGVIGEIGSGCGVGTAWLASGLAAEASLVTIEADSCYAAAVESLVGILPNVRVMHGDWRAILGHGPFALLFADGGDAKQQPDVLFNVMQPGGIILLDDFTPEGHWPAEWRGKRDILRAAWLDRADVIATELLVAPTSAVILATKKSSQTSAENIE